jgi:hypothetical protein
MPINALRDNILPVSTLAELVNKVGGNDLPIVVCQDEHFDDTVLDFSDGETVTLTQTDEDGKTHTIVLSAKIVDDLAPYLLLWKSKLNPETPKLLRRACG